MSTVAEQFPARTDSNGRTWYRPVRDKGMDFAQWGWTSNPAFADPSYAQDVTLCSTEGATAGDRAAILEFAAQLQPKAAVAEADSPPEPATVPAAAAGWLPAFRPTD